MVSKMRCKLKLALLGVFLLLNTAKHVSSECTESFFDCKNGKCIAHFFQCDYDNDCGNFEDEMNCFDNDGNGNVANPHNSINHTLPSLLANIFKVEHHCPEGHFRCNDSLDTCIPRQWVCDGSKECMNEADEKNCTETSVDCADDFKCANNHQCVPTIWRCDGVYDCDDDSDEKNCTSFKKVQYCDLQYGMYECRTGECITFNKVCDHKKDCLLGDDENNCDHTKDACSEKKCSHLCIVDSRTNNATCACPPGYTLHENDTCRDFDECEDNKMTNMCSQKCINLEGSFKCACFDDYQLAADNNSCLVKNDSPILYFSTGKEIRAFNLRTKSYYPVVETHDKEIIVGMDVDIKSNKLYYFGSEENSHGSIYAVPLDGGEQNIPKMDAEVLFHEDFKGVEGIALDWLAGHFYLTESSKNRIIVCSIEPLICATLVHDTPSPRGIVTMPVQGQLYWTQWGDHPGIFHSLMDGSNATMLIDNVQWPNDLAVDEVMNRLYWCDGKDGLIEYFDLDKKIRHTVYRDHTRQPYSLSVFEDYIYWSDWASYQIESCQKISGHQLKPIISDGLQRFFGLTVYHPVMQRATSIRPFNPCRVSPCSHICLLRGYSQSPLYSCHCPDHMILSANNHTCIHKNDEPFALVNTGRKVYKYYLNSIASEHTEELPILPLYSIDEIAYNYDRDELYIHDTYKQRLGRLNLKLSSHLQWRTLAVTQLNGIMSLVYDINTDQLYWVNMFMGTLETLSTDGLYRATLANELGRPISLAINAHARKIFVGVRAKPGAIISVDMDGTNRKTLISSPTGLPLAIASIDNRLIWGDPVVQKIEMINFDYQKMTTQAIKLVSNQVNTINSMVFYNETIYWTNIEMAAFYYTRLQSGKQVAYQKRLSDPHVNLDHLKVVIGAKQTPMYDFCLREKHRCAHLCLISLNGPSCKCSDGYTTTDDGRTCTKASYQPQPVQVSGKQKTFLDPQQFFIMLTNDLKESDYSKDTWITSEVHDPDVKKVNTLQASKDNKSSNITFKHIVTNVQPRGPTMPVVFVRAVQMLTILICVVLVYNYYTDKQFLTNLPETMRSRLRFVQLNNFGNKNVRFFRNPNYNPDHFNSAHEDTNPTIPVQSGTTCNNGSESTLYPLAPTLLVDLDNSQSRSKEPGVCNNN